MNQQKVVPNFRSTHARSIGFEKAELRITLDWNRAVAEEGVPVAQTAPGALERAQQLIVLLWALGYTVAQLPGMHADLGAPTTVETRATVVVTARLVLVAWAVVDLVAPHEDGQTESSFGRAPEVGLGAQINFRVILVPFRKGSRCEGPCPGELDDGRGRWCAGYQHPAQAAVLLVCGVQAVLYPVTMDGLGNTLKSTVLPRYNARFWEHTEKYSTTPLQCRVLETHWKPIIPPRYD